VVTSSVVAHGAVVGRGARVTGSVLLGAVAAPAGERLEGAFRGARQPSRRR
jgi:hypothetical protein